MTSYIFLHTQTRSSVCFVLKVGDLFAFLVPDSESSPIISNHSSWNWLQIKQLQIWQAGGLNPSHTCSAWQQISYNTPHTHTHTHTVIHLFYFFFYLLWPLYEQLAASLSVRFGGLNLWWFFLWTDQRCDCMNKQMFSSPGGRTPDRTEEGHSCP